MTDRITGHRTDYSSEAELVADLDRVCRHHGWDTTRELPVTIGDADDGKYVWGRIDLLARRDPTPQDRRPRPLLIEAKHVIQTLPDLRRAVQQAHGYRAAMGVRANVLVVAAAVLCDVPSEFIEGTYKVKVFDVEEFEAVMASSAWLQTDVLLRASPHARNAADTVTLLGAEQQDSSAADDVARRQRTPQQPEHVDQGRQARKAWREQRGHDPSDDYDFPVTVRKAEDGAV